MEEPVGSDLFIETGISVGNDARRIFARILAWNRYVAGARQMPVPATQRYCADTVIESFRKLACVSAPFGTEPFVQHVRPTE